MCNSDAKTKAFIYTDIEAPFCDSCLNTLMMFNCAGERMIDLHRKCDG